jgi:hypothetical protein
VKNGGEKKEIFEEKPGKVLSKRIRVAMERRLVQERGSIGKEKMGKIKENIVIVWNSSAILWH